VPPSPPAARAITASSPEPPSRRTHRVVPAAGESIGPGVGCCGGGGISPGGCCGGGSCCWGGCGDPELELLPPHPPKRTDAATAKIHAARMPPPFAPGLSNRMYGFTGGQGDRVLDKSAMRATARLASVFALGAVLGTAGDQLHVRSGVLHYPSGSLLVLGQPLWVPLLFGAAAVALVLGHAPILRAMGARPARGTMGALGTAVLWFYAAYASTALLAGRPYALAAALLFAWCARVAFAPAADEIAAGLLYAVLGPAFEAALSATGAFRYASPDLLLVPVWLPALYLHVSRMTRETYLLFFGGEAGGRLPPAGASRGS
jgi:hypothetical protein